MDRRLIGGCLLALLLHDTASLGAEDWPFPYEYRREIQLSPLQADAAELDTAMITFEDGGKLRGPLRGLIIADGAGNIVPYEVLFAKGGRSTFVAFQPSAVKGKLWVYYGGRQSAPSPRTDWQPRLSLLLKTMPMPRGALNSYHPIAAAAQTPRIYGVGLVDQIYHGANPFGPDDRFASAYVGYLRITKPGKYRIFTNSDEASFVLMDGEVICAWPGKHPAGDRRGEHGENLDLKAGLYRIEYYHAETTGPQVMSLGWTLPGSRRYQIIPGSAYVKTPTAPVGAPQRRAGRPLAAFKWNQVDQLLHDQFQYTRVRFVDQSANVPDGAVIRYDYGDAQSSTGPGAAHIYVGDGPFSVVTKVTDAGGKVLDEYRSTIDIRVDRRNHTIGNRRVLREYLESIMGYDLRIMSPQTMTAYWAIGEVLEDSLLIQPFTEVTVQRFGLTGAGWYVGERLAEAYAATDPQKAVALYARLARKAPSGIDAARAKMEQIEIIIHSLKDYDRALTQVRSVPSRNKLAARICKVKEADVYRAKGEFAKAEEIYRKLQKINLRRADPRQVAVEESAYLETVSAYLQQKQLRAARNELMRWEAAYPTGKLTGDLILVTAKYFQLVGDHRRALSELQTLLKLNPLSPYLPEVQYHMARSHKALGNDAIAQKLLQKVLREYPNSRAARLAKRKGLN